MATFKQIVDANLKCGDLPTTRGQGCGASNFCTYRTPMMMKHPTEVDFIAKCLECGVETPITMKAEGGIIKPQGVS
jgi:hypothetical protein